MMLAIAASLTVLLVAADLRAVGRRDRTPRLGL
jgi:hypothetical protein